MSCETHDKLQSANVVSRYGSQHVASRYATGNNSAQSETLYMLGNSLHGNWGSPRLPGMYTGLRWEVQGRKPMINGRRQSDGGIVPEKSPNNPQGAMGMDGRPPVKGEGARAPISPDTEPD